MRIFKSENIEQSLLEVSLLEILLNKANEDYLESSEDELLKISKFNQTKLRETLHYLKINRLVKSKEIDKKSDK